MAETIPAVAPDNGDVAMPLREAFEFYGTPRGAVPNYVNGFAVQSFAYTTPFDAVGTAPDINVPTLVVHSENALAPPLARQFIAGLRVRTANSGCPRWDRSISTTIRSSSGAPRCGGGVLPRDTASRAVAPDRSRRTRDRYGFPYENASKHAFRRSMDSASRKSNARHQLV